MAEAEVASRHAEQLLLEFCGAPGLGAFPRRWLVDRLRLLGRRLRLFLLNFIVVILAVISHCGRRD